MLTRNPPLPSRTLTLVLKAIQDPHGGYDSLLDEGRVQVLMESLKVHGLLQPIGVHRVGCNAYLRFGRHRLEAARRLGWETIDVVEKEDRDVDADRVGVVETELDRLAENLHRGAPSPEQRAKANVRYSELLAERNQIMPAEHDPGPVIYGQVAQKSGRRGRPRKPNSARAIAEKTGQSRRTVQRDLKHLATDRVLGEHLLQKVAGTCLDTPAEREALADLSEFVRDALVGRAAAGEQVSARLAKALPILESDDSTHEERLQAAADLMEVPVDLVRSVDRLREASPQLYSDVKEGKITLEAADEAIGLSVSPPADLPGDIADRQALRAFRQWRVDHGARPKLAGAQDMLDEIERMLDAEGACRDTQ